MEVGRGGHTRSKQTGQLAGHTAGGEASEEGPEHRLTRTCLLSLYDTSNIYSKDGAPHQRYILY